MHYKLVEVIVKNVRQRRKDMLENCDYSPIKQESAENLEDVVIELANELDRLKPMQEGS